MPNSAQSSDDLLSQRVSAVCDAVGDFIAYWGFRQIHGRVWTYLALRKVPVSQSEVARTLGVSRALVHSAIHELNNLGLVLPVGEGRTARWQARIDVWPVITDVLRDREWQLIDTARLSLEACIEEAELAAQEGEIEFDINRMRVLLSLTEMAGRFLRFLVALRATKTFEGMGELVGRAANLVRGLRRLR